ncbi:hypothetical protein HY450_03745 [Candidatus Pacearchaeota archaeon]|nr:hypothetical protein [Candidatus Pacearchaeota archaeon]
MKQKNLWILLVSFIALAVFATQSVSAFGTIAAVEVNGVDALNGNLDFANFAGERVPVLVRFDATAPAEDVRIKAWISGESQNAVVTERFDVINGSTYVRILEVEVPFDLDDPDEPRNLEIVVESAKNGIADQESIDFTIERASYVVEVLSVNFLPEVKAGETLPVDIVLKNRGRQFAEDTFVDVKIPELGIETRVYFGDLSPIDQGGNAPDKEDAVERRAFLKLPVNTKAGLYTLEIEAFNSDAITQLERKVLVSSAGSEAEVFPSSTSQTFAVGEIGEYKLTVVNKGTTIGVYNIVVDSGSNIDVSLSESVIVVPAGSSRTFSVFADSSNTGSNTFSVSILSQEGEVVGQETLIANVEGEGKSTANATAGNTTILLTIILAIIFIVLLVVLIVLLTRKPETKEEFGESYY